MNRKTQHISYIEATRCRAAAISPGPVCIFEKRGGRAVLALPFETVGRSLAQDKPTVRVEAGTARPASWHAFDLAPGRKPTPPGSPRAVTAQDAVS